MGLPLQGLAVAVQQAAERQGRGRALQQHRVVRRGGAGARAEQHQPAPVVAARAHRRDQPAGPGVGSRPARRGQRAGAALPAVEQCARVVGGRVEGQHLVGQVLQHDGRARHPRHLADHGGRLRALHGQLVERLVHRLRGAQLRELGVHHQRVHGLGHGDEADLVGQRDQRQPAAVGRADQRVRQPVGVAAAQLHDEPGGADVGEGVHVGGQARGRLGEHHAGGQHEFAAAQGGRDVGEFADVGPADLRGQARRPGHRHRAAGPYGVQGQHFGDGGQHGDLRSGWGWGGPRLRVTSGRGAPRSRHRPHGDLRAGCAEDTSPFAR